MTKLRSLLVAFFAVLASQLVAQRIVSLAPSVTYTLHQLGVGDKVVGRTSYCVDTNKKAQIVGDALTVSVEKIVSLRPDVVFAMPLTKVATIAKLRQMGINVVELQTPKSFDEICSQTIQMSQLTNCEAFATQLVERERQIIDSLRNTALSGSKKMFFQIGTNPLFGVIHQTFMDDFITFCGCKNVITQGNGMILREYVVSQQPDFVVVTSLGGLANSEVAEWQRMLTARYLIVDEIKSGCPSPIFFREILEQILNFISEK